jgi:hypothetical protein
MAGIALLDYADASREIFDMPRIWGAQVGVLTEILGPGHLRVREDNGEYTLRANEIVVHDELLHTKPVREWLHEVSVAAVANYKSTPRHDCTRPDLSDADWLSERKRPVHDVWIMWSRILREAMRQGHGGAIVVVPQLPNTCLKITFPLDPYDVANELVDVWSSLCRLWIAKSTDEIQRCVEDKRQKTHHLLSLTRSIGSLSGTDGCVVFDRRMALHGFGASIDVKRDGPESRRCVDLRQDIEVSRDQLLKSYGERHRSAYYLCHEVPGTISFVMSQDGDLRVFASDQDHIYFASNLHP